MLDEYRPTEAMLVTITVTVTENILILLTQT